MLFFFFIFGPVFKLRDVMLTVYGLIKHFKIKVFHLQPISWSFITELDCLFIAAKINEVLISYFLRGLVFICFVGNISLRWNLDVACLNSNLRNEV